MRKMMTKLSYTCSFVYLFREIAFELRLVANVNANLNDSLLQAGNEAGIDGIR